MNETKKTLFNINKWNLAIAAAAFGVPAAAIGGEIAVNAIEKPENWYLGLPNFQGEYGVSEIGTLFGASAGALALIALMLIPSRVRVSEVETRPVRVPKWD